MEILNRMQIEVEFCIFIVKTLRENYTPEMKKAHEEYQHIVKEANDCGCAVLNYTFLPEGGRGPWGNLDTGGIRNSLKEDDIPKVEDIAKKGKWTFIPGEYIPEEKHIESRKTPKVFISKGGPKCLKITPNNTIGLIDIGNIPKAAFNAHTKYGIISLKYFKDKLYWSFRSMLISKAGLLDLHPLIFSDHNEHDFICTVDLNMAMESLVKAALDLDKQRTDYCILIEEIIRILEKDYVAFLKLCVDTKQDPKLLAIPEKDRIGYELSNDEKNEKDKRELFVSLYNNMDLGGSQFYSGNCITETGLDFLGIEGINVNKDSKNDDIVIIERDGITATLHKTKVV